MTDDEKDDLYLVYKVRFQLGGRLCESEYPFLNETAAKSFVTLLEEDEEVTDAQYYGYYDKEYVEKRVKEPERMDSAVSGL